MRYVGRSDTSVKRRLLDHAREDDYDYFFVEHKKMPIDAFVRECNLYHRHVNTVENEAHPNRPRGYRGPCPRCHEFR